MSLSAAFNVISSSFAANSAQTAVVSNNIANANTPGYSREIANVVTNSYGGADVASVTREANAALLEQVSSSTAAGGDATGDLRRAVDARRDRQRQFIVLFDLGREPERRLAFGHARQSAKRADNLRRLADLVVRRRGRGIGRLRSRRRPSTRRARRSRRCANRPIRTWRRRSARSIRLLSQFTAANNAVVSGLQTGANVASAEDTRDSIVTQLCATDRRLDGHRRQWLEVDLHRQRRHPVPGHAARRRLHPDPDAGRRRERRAGHRRWRADHRRQFADAHSIGRARRLRGAAGYARAAISSPARPDRRRPHQRLRGKRPIGDPDAAVAARPVHHRRSDQPAFDVGDDGPRRRDRGQSERRSVAGRQCESLARRRHLRPRKPSLSPTIRPARRVIPGASSSSSARSAATQNFDPSAGLGSSSSLADYANASVSWLQGENQQAERLLLLSECARHPGDLGAVERNRRQSRRRDDQHAQPRKFIRLLGEAVDHRHQHVLRPPARRMTTMSANFVSTQTPRQQPGGAGHAGAVVADHGDDRGVHRPIRRSRPASSAINPATSFRSRSRSGRSRR